MDLGQYCFQLVIYKLKTILLLNCRFEFKSQFINNIGNKTFNKAIYYLFIQIGGVNVIS